MSMKDKLNQLIDESPNEEGAEVQITMRGHGHPMAGVIRLDGDLFAMDFLAKGPRGDDMIVTAFFEAESVETIQTIRSKVEEPKSSILM